MLKLSKFKLLAIAAVLIALLAAVGGLVISQAAGGQSSPTSRESSVKRSSIQRQRPRALDVGPWTAVRAEVFNPGEKWLYDSGRWQGKALNR